MFDTNDYIHRFLSGELSGNRKHSEVINKILAGYIDSDGSVGLTRDKEIRISLSQAAVNDPDFEVMRAFHRHYKMGSIIFRFSDNPNESSRADWRLGHKDSVKLYHLLGKHLLVKGLYLHNLVNAEPEDRAAIKKEWGPIKRKKHPSPAWFAGLVAGDGHLCCRLNRERERFDKRVGKSYDSHYNELYVVVVGEDESILKFLQEHYKGSVYDKKTYFAWKRSLGRGNKSFSLAFLKSIKPYMLHPKKYLTIKRMIKHLNGPAETKQAEDENPK